MNLREGTRRLALLLGVVGASLGGVVSYAQLQSLMRQSADHRKFEQLAASDVLQRERKCRLLGYTSGCSLTELPPGYTLDKPASRIYPVRPGTAVGQPNDWQTVSKSKVYLDDNGNPVSAPGNAPQTDSNPGGRYAIENADGTPLDSEVNRGGIKTIYWSHDYGVTAIETEGGQTLYPTTAPGAGSYSLTAILPLLGFFVPWGAVRAIGWVGAGFIAG